MAFLFSLSRGLHAGFVPFLSLALDKSPEEACYNAFVVAPEGAMLLHAFIRYFRIQTAKRAEHKFTLFYYCGQPYLNSRKPGCLQADKLYPYAPDEPDVQQDYDNGEDHAHEQHDPGHLPFPFLVLLPGEPSARDAQEHGDEHPPEGNLFLLLFFLGHVKELRKRIKKFWPRRFQRLNFLYRRYKISS